MGNKVSSKQKPAGGSCIIEAKTLLKNGDEAGAFAVLKEAAEKENVMACFDCGFMMMQGIGCEKNWRKGLEMFMDGDYFEKKSEDMSWKSDGSATEVMKPQTIDFGDDSFMCSFFFLFWTMCQTTTLWSQFTHQKNVIQRPYLLRVWQHRFTIN